MMRVLKGLCLWLLLFLGWDASAQDIYCAIPPAPKPINIAQPDGSFLKVIPKGDPSVHWLETTDGYTVVKNKQGIYEYAIRQGGALVPSGIKPGSPLGQNVRINPNSLNNIEKHLKPTGTQAATMRANMIGKNGLNARAQAANAEMPVSGDVNVLCILIEYPDLPHSFSKSNFSSLFNGPLSDGRRSFAEFYDKNSFGKLQLKVDVAGWYKAEDNFSEYGNDGSKSSYNLVAEAIEAAAKDGMDFTKYDNDNDGVVDGLMVVHSGPGGEEGSSSQYIWSHMSYVNEYAGDVEFSPYLIGPETRNNGYGKNGMVGMGIFAHEFGHLLGLPDLYDTQGDSEGIGEWGLMGSGNWLGDENSPAGFSAWSKETLGWLEPVDITDNFNEFKLNPAHSKATAYKIRTQSPNEYFLLENRQLSGVDESLNGHGLAIWHINTKKTRLYPGDNSVNGNYRNKGVGLQEADGSFDLDNGWNRGDDSDLYPAGHYELTLFDYSTEPGSDLNETYQSSKTTGISISNIQEDGNTVSFTYKKETPGSGGDCSNAAVAVAGENFSPKLNYYFTYTMPESGLVSISTDDSDLYIEGTLYRSCDEVNDDGGELIYIDGSISSEREYKIGYAEKGETFIFRWDYYPESDITGDESFYFDLNVETGAVATQDSLALVAMYKKMGGKNWYSNENWLENPVSSWENVSVKNGRVTAIDLADLENSIPDEFYDLTGLKKLGLSSYDSLKGKLDARIGDFTALEEVAINTVGLEIDFLDKLDGTLSQLTDFNVVAYKVNGSLPANIGKMKKLRALSIQAYSFKSSIPNNIGDIPNLTSLALIGELTGEIPESLAHAKKLRFLDLSFNNLTGDIPNALAEISSLEYINLSSNELTGDIPSKIFDLPYLTSFYADHNELESMPENLFASSSIEFLDISYNQISGSLPNLVSEDNYLEVYLYLNNNKISGTVPENLENMYFSYLDLSHNQLEGALPLLNFSSGLDIGYNRFTSLPDLNEDDEYSYKTLYCQNNQLSFDDIIPNLPILICSDCELYGEDAGDEYSQFNPQDSVNLNVSKAINRNDAYTIELNIDQDLKDNTYQWYRNGKLVSTTKTNKLTIESFDTTSIGEFYCVVKNVQLDNFSLHYGGIKLSLKDNKQDQRMVVSSVADKKYNDKPFKLEVQNYGIEEVLFEVLDGPVEIIEDSVKIGGTGDVRIKVYNDGNDQYNPVDTVVAFTIEKADQKISYSQPKNIVYGQDEFLLDVAASSSLPVALEVVKGQIEINGPSVTILGAGPVSLIARQGGDNNYNSADSVAINFEVAKATQVVLVDSVGDYIYGAPPFEVNVSSDAGLPVKLTALTSNIKVDSNRISILSAGPASFKVTQEGNSDIQAAEEKVITFDIAKAVQTLSFERIGDKILGSEPFDLKAFSNKQLPVSFRVVDGAEFIQLENNQVTLLKAGSVHIEAYQEGNENYSAVAPQREGFTIIDTAKSAQTLTVMEEIPDTVVLSSQNQYDFSATSSSGLQPTYVVEGPAELADGQLLFKEEGNVKVIVSQQGDDEYNAAPTIVKEYLVIGNVPVEKGPQTITLKEVGDKVYGDDPFSLGVTTSSGLPVTYEVSGPVSVEDGTVTINGAGEAVIQVTQEGDESYLAVDTTIQFTIAKAEQTITYSAPQNVVFGQSAFLLDIISSSGLPVSLALDSGNIVLEGKKVSIKGAGTAVLTATQSGNENYNAAAPETVTFDIARAPQTLTFEVEPVDDTTFLLMANSSVDLPVTFTIESGDAQISEDTLYVAGDGTVKVIASQEGTDNYLPAESIERTIEIKLITGIDDDIVNLIRIYPNPSHNIFFLEFQEERPDTQVGIYTPEGKVVMEKPMTDKLTEIDLSTKPEGVYFVRFYHNDRWFNIPVILN